MKHILSQLEFEIGIQAFDGPVPPSLMTNPAGIHIEALLLPSLVPRTLRRSSYTPVRRRFTNFEDKLWPHRRLSKKMRNPFYIFGIFCGQSVRFSKFLRALACFIPKSTIEILETFLAYRLFQRV